MNSYLSKMYLLVIYNASVHAQIYIYLSLSQIGLLLTIWSRFDLGQLKLCQQEIWIQDLDNIASPTTDCLVDVRCH